MIVVDVQLHSAVTGDVTSLNRVVITNISGAGARRDYQVRSFRKGTDPVVTGLSRNCNRIGIVEGHAAERESVLTLLRKALEGMGY